MAAASAILSSLLLALAAMVPSTAGGSHGDCEETPGYHCITFVCSKWSGFICLVEFKHLRDLNPNPKGKHKAHPSEIRDLGELWGPGSIAIDHMVELKASETIQNLKVKHDFMLGMYVWSLDHKHAEIKIDRSGEVVCTGGVLTPRCYYK